MADIQRRHMLTGLLVGSGALGLASAASAQNKGQDNYEAQTVQNALQDYKDPDALAVTPMGQDWANLHRYKKSNDEVAAWPEEKRRVIMMGDSITDNWPGLSGSFFSDNGLVGRGISGQTTAQMLVRFMPEVVALRPKAVHIMGGTNDIAENQDPYDPVATTNNLQAMANLASVYGIKVIMASVPPATSFNWHMDIGNPNEKIVALNTWIKSVCETPGYTYVDYWPVLATADGALKPELGLDSVHPNAAGYAAMDPLTLAAIGRALA
ncbi:MAG: GDSL-type esterase/lipase family protein [Asticcacaulis sp.]